MEKTLGCVIAETRKAKGMTQLELAEKMGVTDKAVSKWERDLACPDVSSLPLLARTLELSLDELMQGKAEKPEAKSAGQVIDLALKAVALAMGAAVVVTNVLGRLDTASAVNMLGIGMTALAIYLLRQKA